MLIKFVNVNIRTMTNSLGGKLNFWANNVKRTSLYLPLESDKTFSLHVVLGCCSFVHFGAIRRWIRPTPFDFGVVSFINKQKRRQNYLVDATIKYSHSGVRHDVGAALGLISTCMERFSREVASPLFQV